VDHASLASLVTDLLTTIHLLSGYPAVSVQPEIHRLPQAAIAEKVCHKPCGVRAYYRPDWGVLLDESLPRPLAKQIVGHDARTVSQMKWTSLGNGELLKQAAAAFDVFLTADQNIEFQQNLATLPIAVVVLVADSNRLESLEPLVPAILQALETAKPRTLVRVRP